MKGPKGARKMNMKNEVVADLEKKIMALENSKRKLMGEDLDSCSLDELQELEHQLDKALANVKARKNKVVAECIEKLKEKERFLSIENVHLKKRIAFTKTKPPHIPQELLPGILCNLPVKSLLRFRCVSKSWQSLIQDPEFARLHLKNNRDETHLLVVHNGLRNIVVRRSDTFGMSSETLLTLGSSGHCKSWDIVNSIDGLVLLRRSQYGDECVDLKVWNPSIRRFHEFPSVPRVETSSRRYVHVRHEEIGLGYDPVANDYKHVKLILVKEIGPVPSVAIYSLGTGSWKAVPFQGKGCSWHWDLHGGASRYRDQVIRETNRKVCLRGSLHYLAIDVNQPKTWDLVSFDLISETFSSVRLLPDMEGSKELALIDGGCSLAVFSCVGSSQRPDYSLWVLESAGGGSESICWTKRYSFKLKLSQFLYVKENGDMLIRMRRTENIADGTGEKSVSWDQVVSYSPESKDFKIVQEKNGSNYLISGVFAYAESLLLLNFFG